MEVDDEFGDLYTDVLQPFASSSPSTPKSQPIPPHHVEAANALSNHANQPSLDSDVKFDIEDEEIDHAPLIPGLSSAAVHASGRIVAQGHGWDDSDDSDDDLQIVLDNNSLAAPGDDGAVDIAAAVADAEQRDWDENSTQPMDGEKKDAGDLAKAVAPKIGYSNQGFHHPFHSQFKYVRPGAAPIHAATSSTPGVPSCQVRPLANMNPVAGHGRGDWRPAGLRGAAAMQKGFQGGSGLPAWGNNAAGRGFGGGLDFMLPSHKTIFDVDIDSFEDKLWKYPGVDVSDFFNFGLNEDTWKDYCKQLEQLRLESTMQSKIHVYESGRTEQDYDPDLPPELAAASGIHAVPVNNANSVKSDVGQNDLIKGSGPMRPPIPTGRAIQVECGSGDRLPSIDTRPPRIRDSDAIIEDLADNDSSARIDVQDQQEGSEPQRDDFSEDHVVGHEIPRLELEYFSGFPQDYNGQKRELMRRKMPYMKASLSNIPLEDKNLPFPQEKQVLGRVCDQSPHITCSREMEIVDNKKEESDESMEGRHSVHLSSPAIEDVMESSIENKQLEGIGTADESSRLEKEDINLNTVDIRDTVKDEIAERQEVTSQVEQPLMDDTSDWEDSKAVRSSDNSKAKSETSKDYHKQLDGFEVVQDPESVHRGSIRLQQDENSQVFNSRERDGRQKPEKNGMVIKSREDPYPHKDRHPSSAHQLRAKIDGFDSQRDRVSSDMGWECRDDDLYGRRVKNDEPRKTDRGRVRENERSDNDDSFHSRKQLDNGSYRALYDKDVRPRVSRNKERDDSLKGKHDAVEDFHCKRRKNEEYLRRELVGKEVLRGYRENISQHKPEKDSVLDLRKRDNHQRGVDNLDDQYASRHKKEAWLMRERGNRKRDREEWQQVKQSQEEHPSKRERGRGSVRSGWRAEEKTLVDHVRAKDNKVSEKEHQSREALRRSDQLKRTDRNKGESHRKGHNDTYVHGNQYSCKERRSRKEKSSSRGDCATNAVDSQRVDERKRDEGSRKSKEPIVGSLGSLGPSKRSPEDQSGQINDKGTEGSGDEEHVEDEIPGHRLSRKKHGEDLSDDSQLGSQQGRSKYERRTNHKERDFSISNRSSSSSSKLIELDRDDNDGSSESGKPVDEPSKLVDDNNQPLLSGEGNDFVDILIKDANAKGLEDQHLDTVEKLKKRSERFKLPMPSEKEALVIKKVEGEPLPSAENENPTDSEVKQERPPRKRRWILFLVIGLVQTPETSNILLKDSLNRYCLLPNLCLGFEFEMSARILYVVDSWFGKACGMFLAIDANIFAYAMRGVNGLASLIRSQGSLRLKLVLIVLSLATSNSLLLRLVSLYNFSPLATSNSLVRSLKKKIPLLPFFESDTRGA
ncbi:hypothetical protein VNO78_23165 [Psophocarpus tetragonolobus]|uniref:Pre-mRNA polyadenylation factor Fip1 domain-containing protein n=1 Tax=Psophocarpus tetragonolobus TaxID=3891 RepID=A0AAN9XDE7_PSOTE